MTAMLADGHILLEDFPGLAKTMIANSFATALGLDFKRIQFTPDLLPGDITGGYIYDRTTNQFELRKGLIFANIVLADEINRASPKTQSALLEAMQERQVTIEGETMKLPEPFIVIATQNPIESEGTFPLPEAQLDRFLMKLSVGYPTPKEEQEILNRRKQREHDQIELNVITDSVQIQQMRQAIEEVFIGPDLERYIVDLVGKTRQHARVTAGASPRAGLALLKLALGRAVIEKRDYVLPDDIKLFIDSVLIHRLILVPDLWMKAGAASDVIEGIGNSVPVPLLKEN
ncbi:MAG: AAA family ATPase [Deltaproteobacteria bacterium]|jgi:MoxR-like ATPase|nr:AAA family ATPase [Deltaproteobacteria bacterium]MBT4641059.1 AAA family ATPase [Deltaproteobacteria bacterium]MBT6498794.1 AAA family ATPase [Deltaproteobacteria bacterium]MBT7153854.1 AAA family ATPase [Deltaproteobacteria bacterium]MBT7712988.1 AAA family ATPase [Deltaproteobacteria bacterium]